MKCALAIILASFSISVHANSCEVQLSTKELAFDLNAITAIEAGPIENSKAHGLILSFEKVGKILLEFPTKEDLAAGLILMGNTAIENECSLYIQRFLTKSKEKSTKQESGKRPKSKLQI